MPIEGDLEQISIQERELSFRHFDAETAWNLGTRLRELACIRGIPVVCDIRRFGQQLFYTALSGATPDNAEWVRRKSNLVARFLRSSYAIGLDLRRQNTNLLEKYGLASDEYASHGGSFPICVHGTGVIGSVTVSGLPQRDDHELVVKALCQELGCDYKKLALAVPA